ncbi:MAG TPA: hypothetical protein VGH28_05905 [Polyangiaceae bacterium]|jgi:hypothetical protein
MRIVGFAFGGIILSALACSGRGDETSSTAQAQTSEATTIASPVANSAQSSSSVHVVASSTSASLIRVCQVYVDGTKAFEQTNATTHCDVDTDVTVGEGAHTLTVQALNTKYAVASHASVSFSVSAPDGAYADIDQALPWQTCGNCANSGASGATAYTSLVGVTAPSEDGHAMLNTVGEGTSGANHPPYGDAYWWKEHGALSSRVVELEYALDLYIPATNDEGQPTDPQAIEFEVQQTRNNRVYNFAWQNDYSQNEWRVFQIAAPGHGAWLPSGITGASFGGSTKLATNAWHHIATHFSVDTSTDPETIHHDYLDVDGTRYFPTTNVHAYVVPSSDPRYPRRDQFSNAVQLDMRGVACNAGSSPSCRQGSDGVYRIGVPFHVAWDKINLAYWF